MKKLTLLLAAVTIASAAYAKEVMPVAEVAAAPMLTVTSIGQYIEIDNYSENSNSDGDVGHVMLGNTVNFAYGDDWTFGIMARKGWDTDTDDGFGSNSSRIDLYGMKAYENYNLGLKWRQENGKDEYMLRGNYSYGMFSGWGDLQYASIEGKADRVEFEGVVAAVKYKTVKLGYYLNYYDYDLVSDIAAGEMKSEARHQVRISAPIYSGDKLDLGLEYRYQFNNDKDYNGTATNGYTENTRQIVVLSADYAVNDNLSLSGYYEYDFNDYEEFDGSTDGDDDYYGEFCVGWTYKF
jgi:hypothetical protein